MTPREQVRRQAIREAIARVQSGEWTLSTRQKAQVRAIQKADTRERAAAPLHESLREGLQLLLNQDLTGRAKRIVKKLLNILAAEDEPAEAMKALRAGVKSARQVAQLIEKSRGGVTRKEAGAQLLKRINQASQEKRPADGVKGPGRPRNDDSDPAALAAEKLTEKAR